MSDASKVPYLQSHGNITKALNGIQNASIPEKFTQDFLGGKLDLSGGSARPIIPFLKRAGFLASEGTPTALYRRFKNPALAGAAAAEGMKNAYSSLYEVHEYVHALPDDKVRGVILQVTGLESDSQLVRSMLGSFKALKAFADFEAKPGSEQETPPDETAGSGGPGEAPGQPIDRLPLREAGAIGVQLGYTINLNLPATTDIAVFNAIFKSLREHLLR